MKMVQGKLETPELAIFPAPHLLAQVFLVY